MLLLLSSLFSPCGRTHSSEREGGLALAGGRRDVSSVQIEIADCRGLSGISLLRTNQLKNCIPGFFRILLHGWRVAVPVLEADHRAPAARHEVDQQHGEARQPAPHPAKLHRPQLRVDIFCFDIEISQL